MITAFLPCRAGSERVKLKNTRAFAGRPGGLLEIKIEQLLSCSKIDQIILSTNDDNAISVARERFGEVSNLKIIQRPDCLCSSSTSTDELIRYVPSIIERGSVLWTHVTSPFFTGYHYDKVIESYTADILSGCHDSLMTVTEERKFIWDNEAPINYDRAVEKWPRTQTLKPLYEVNSAAFLVDISLMAEYGDRIGKTPRLFAFDKKISFDIDWQDDFDLAEMMWLYNERVQNFDR